MDEGQLLPGERQVQGCEDKVGVAAINPQVARVSGLGFRV